MSLQEIAASREIKEQFQRSGMRRIWTLGLGFLHMCQSEFRFRVQISFGRFLHACNCLMELLQRLL